MALLKKHIARYREIIFVFTKHGFGLLLEQLGLYRYLNLTQKRLHVGDNLEHFKLSPGQRLRLSLEELGPTFVKLGQILSTRPDILPADVIEELKKLQSSVKPFPFSLVKECIETEFEDCLDRIYPEFEEEPVASASISQVHRATLATGKQVAVKVQRPGIEKIIEADLDILKDLAHFIDHHTKYGKLYDLSGMVAEFETTIKNELDFTKEGENADIFRKNFRYDKGIAVPQIRWIYTTKRILTMEYIDGIPINDSHALEQAGIDKRMVAERLAISICNQILRDGFFHADPHPGNIQVLPDGTIVFLDLGMVGRLSAKRKKMLSNFFIGAASKDSALVVRSMMDMDAVSDPGNLRKFEREVDEIIEKYLTMPMNEIKIDALLYEIFQFAFKNQIRIPQEFALLAKSLGILQSLLERLAPDLNALFIAKPIAKKLLRQSFSPEELSREAKKSAWNYGSLLNRFPSFLLNLMNRLEDKDYSMEVKWKGFSAFQRRIEKIFNRISLSMVLLAVSIIIAGVIIGSGASANTGSEMYQLNLLILKSGLLLALILLLVLIISIFRSGRR